MKSTEGGGGLEQGPLREETCSEAGAAFKVLPGGPGSGSSASKAEGHAPLESHSVSQASNQRAESDIEDLIDNVLGLEHRPGTGSIDQANRFDSTGAADLGAVGQPGCPSPRLRLVHGGEKHHGDHSSTAGSSPLTRSFRSQGTCSPLSSKDRSDRFLKEGQSPCQQQKGAKSPFQVYTDRFMGKFSSLADSIEGSGRSALARLQENHRIKRAQPWRSNRQVLEMKIDWVCKHKAWSAALGTVCAVVQAELVFAGNDPESSLMNVFKALNSIFTALCVCGIVRFYWLSTLLQQLEDHLHRGKSIKVMVDYTSILGNPWMLMELMVCAIHLPPFCSYEAEDFTIESTIVYRSEIMFCVSFLHMQDIAAVAYCVVQLACHLLLW